MDANRRAEFEIWTKNGTRVLWGYAPGYELADQPVAEVKLEALARYIQTEGELADFPDPSAFKIDVSDGEAQLIKAERSAELPELPMVDVIK